MTAPRFVQQDDGLGDFLIKEANAPPQAMQAAFEFVACTLSRIATHVRGGDPGNTFKGDIEACVVEFADNVQNPDLNPSATEFANAAMLRIAEAVRTGNDGTLAEDIERIKNTFFSRVNALSPPDADTG